jgi:hemerythrin-like metal-binding protein
MNDSLEIFPWTEKFNTGILQIDEQHQRLVHLLNALATNVKVQTDIPSLNFIFTELAEYVMYHFQTEENLWHHFLAGDTWENEHKMEHNSFVSIMIRLENEEDSKPLSEVLDNVVSFLTHWLAFHILESDKRLSLAVLSVQAGIPLIQAKIIANRKMKGALLLLVETLLSMDQSLSSRTLQLIRLLIDRQRTDEKLCAAGDATVDPAELNLEAICITDADLKLLDANSAFSKMTRCTDSEIGGKRLESLKTGIQNEPLYAEILEHLAAKGHWKGKINYLSENGAVYPERLILAAVRNDQGAISNYVGVFLLEL